MRRALIYEAPDWPEAPRYSSLLWPRSDVRELIPEGLSAIGREAHAGLLKQRDRLSVKLETQRMCTILGEHETDHSHGSGRQGGGPHGSGAA